MLRFCLLGSGSSGNAALVVSDNAKILIDDGLSVKKLCERAALVGETLQRLDAVFITHEHCDHVQGLGALARKLPVPIYMTEATCRCLPKSVGLLPNVVCIESGDTVTVGDLEVASFQVTHDAADPVCYTIRSQGVKLGFATDLGHCSTLVKTRLAGSHALVLESNYCPEMLRCGIYPPQVQQRIRSRVGHLSNQDASSLLSDLLHTALRTVVLVHISENNNTPELARSMAAGVVKNHPAALFLASQHAPTPLFEVCA